MSVCYAELSNSTLGASNFGHTGEDGYYFVADHNPNGQNSDVYSLPTYVTAVDHNLSSNSDSTDPTATITTMPYPGSYSQLSIAGTEYGTGELYYNDASFSGGDNGPILMPLC